MAKLTILWIDNFGENQTPLQKNCMAAIPKNLVEHQNKQGSILKGDLYQSLGQYHNCNHSVKRSCYFHIMPNAQISGNGMCRQFANI